MEQCDAPSCLVKIAGCDSTRERSYRTLAPTPDDYLFGELTLSHTSDDDFNTAASYIRSCEAPDAAYHLVYDGPDMSLNSAP